MSKYKLQSFLNYISIEVIIVYKQIMTGKLQIFKKRNCQLKKMDRGREGEGECVDYHFNKEERGKMSEEWSIITCSKE